MKLAASRRKISPTTKQETHAQLLRREKAEATRCRLPREVRDTDGEVIAVIRVAFVLNPLADHEQYDCVAFVQLTGVGQSRVAPGWNRLE